MNRLRRDPITGHWMVLAAGRRKRPNDFRAPVQGGACPFCPGQEDQTPEASESSVGEGGAWAVRAFPNKFPAFCRLDDDLDLPGEQRGADGLYVSRPAVGFQEVVVSTPEHSVKPWEVSVEQMARLFELLQSRIRALYAEPGIAHVLASQNHGAVAGASRSHPHWQIMALDHVPAVVATEMSNASRRVRSSGDCLWCSVIAEERRLGERIVTATEELTVLAPWAARLPWEVHVLPTVHAARFEDIDDALRVHLAAAFVDLMRRFGSCLGDVPHNVVLHTAPLRANPSAFHWHLELLPRLTHQAGLEWGAGVFVNTVDPAEAARSLRGAS